MKKFGIIGAMELEVDTLISRMELRSATKAASMTFHEGTLNGVEAVIVRSGICKVNAAICAHILAHDFQVTHIINTGVAGSLNAGINIGDIVVSTDVLYHDVDATVWGYQPGEVPQMGIREFKADSSMIEQAVESCRLVNPGIQVFEGRIVSGDQFISDKQVKERLISLFGALCTEMEGAAIAHAAYLNETPFVIIRAISDKADESAEEDYPTFERKAALHSAALVENMIGALS